jgi:glycosyltransferase involved in cell wall biosynthesis
MDYMKILVVSQHYYPEQFRITDICESLASEGHKVTVLTGLPNYPQGKVYSGYSWFKRRNEVKNGVEIIRTPIISRGNNTLKLMINYVSFALNASIKALFLKKDFDIVYVYQTSPVTMAIPALVYKKITGKKVVLNCLDIWPECIAAAGFNRDSVLYKILLLVSRFIYNSADKILVTSKLFVDYFNDVIKINDSKKIEYLPQYAEELYSSNEEATRLNRKEINLMFAGNIGKMQSVDTIIRAAAELRDLENIKWHIVGDGSARVECEKLVEELGIKEKVIFYGQKPVDEMPSFFSKASAMIVTLKNNEFVSYTMPGKVQSYMAAGKVVLGAINGETQKIIEESQCGLCCNAEDYRAFAKIVKQFTENKESHKIYEENSLRYYENNFGKNLVLNNMITTFNEMR